MNAFKAMSQGQTLLDRAGVEAYQLEAGMLLSKVLGISRMEIYLDRDRDLGPGEESEFFALVEERAKGVPIHYLMGHREFMGLNFNVQRGVLIPRPDTEILVEYILEYGKDIDEEPIKILDIGTGSGAIAVSLAKYLKDTVIWAGDIDPGSLDIAKGNALAHGVDHRINFFSGDLFCPLRKMDRVPEFDIMVSNPPYIPSKDIEGLAPEVKDYEPLRALDGGREGLDFYRRLVREAPDFLKDGGLWAVEVGYDQSKEVAGLLERDGRYRDIDFHKDLAGYERVVGARVGKER